MTNLEHLNELADKIAKSSGTKFTAKHWLHQLLIRDARFDSQVQRIVAGKLADQIAEAMVAMRIPVTEEFHVEQDSYEATASMIIFTPEQLKEFTQNVAKLAIEVEKVREQANRNNLDVPTVLGL